MHTVVYDDSFDGFLTAVFDIYDYKLNEVDLIRRSEYQKQMFGIEHVVNTDPKKAQRVWKGLEQKISVKALGQFYRTFLSEIKKIDNTLLSYTRYVFNSPTTVEYDFSHPAVLTVMQTAIKVARERHRMEAFVRFQLTKDNLYYATIQPDFNVLPLIANHFERRYADQRWMIYDVQRRYGIYYDLKSTEVVEMVFNEDVANGKDVSGVIAEEETLYQQLWQLYFASVNIPARKNMKLHIRHMPRRYWKYLTEKKPG